MRAPSRLPATPCWRQHAHAARRTLRSPLLPASLPRAGGGAGVGFGIGWGWGIVRAPRRALCACAGLPSSRSFLVAPSDALCAARQGWGSKIIDTKQAFPRKGENLLESAQAAAADAMNALQGASMKMSGPKAA